MDVHGTRLALTLFTIATGVERGAAGVPKPYSDPPLEEYLVKSGVRLIKPTQYMDRWRLDLKGVRIVPNDAVKHALGLGKEQAR